MENTYRKDIQPLDGKLYTCTEINSINNSFDAIMVKRLRSDLKEKNASIWYDFQPEETYFGICIRYEDQSGNRVEINCSIFDNDLVDQVLNNE